VATPLPTVTLGDLQAFADALAQQDLAPGSRVRTLAAVKSLLAFGQRTGYLPLNVGAALKLPPKKDRLAERILSETQVHRILALEPSKRNQALLRLLYAGGLRVSELAALRWRDLQPRDAAGHAVGVVPAALQAAIARHVQDDADLAAGRHRRGDERGAVARDVLADPARHVAVQGNPGIVPGVGQRRVEVQQIAARATHAAGLACTTARPLAVKLYLGSWSSVVGAPHGRANGL